MKKSIKKSIRIRHKSKTNKSSLPKFNYGYSKAYSPNFSKHFEHVHEYNTGQKKELLRLAIIYKNEKIIKFLLDIGVKPAYFKFVNSNDTCKKSQSILKLLQRYL